MMRNLWLKLRYLRRPYLLKWEIIRFFEGRYNKRMRIGEYGKYLRSTAEGVQRLTGANLDYLKDLEAGLNHKLVLYENIDEARRILGQRASSGLDDSTCRLLYLLCRILSPEIVVETGVGNGFSSAYILQALEDNRSGRLFSIDLHFRNGVAIPIDKELGWVIPEEFKHRWRLILGESFSVLPRLLEELVGVDMFLHDSAHTYRNMMKEFRIVWPYLRNGGLLLSDDVKSNNALLDFCQLCSRTPIVIANRIGAVAK